MLLTENFFCQLLQAAIGKKKIFNPEEWNLAALKRQGKCDRDDADVDDMIMTVFFLPPHCCLFLYYNLRLQEAKSETQRIIQNISLSCCKQTNKQENPKFKPWVVMMIASFFQAHADTPDADSFVSWKQILFHHHNMIIVSLGW